MYQEQEIDKIKKLLYIAQKSSEDINFGSTKLNKILFYTDFYYYGKTGKSISGSTYHNIAHGQAPMQIIPVIKKLKSSKRAEIKEVNHYDYPQMRIEALDNPDLSIFSKDEIVFVDYWIKKLWHDNASDLSNRMHKTTIWKYLPQKVELSYNTVFVLNEEPIGRNGHELAENELKRLRKQFNYAF